MLTYCIKIMQNVTIK